MSDWFDLAPDACCAWTGEELATNKMLSRPIAPFNIKVSYVLPMPAIHPPGHHTIAKLNKGIARKANRGWISVPIPL
jgi:hypothetical protein